MRVSLVLFFLFSFLKVLAEKFTENLSTQLLMEMYSQEEGHTMRNLLLTVNTNLESENGTDILSAKLN